MIDKLTALDMFAENYRPLSETKKSEFARIVSRLLNSTFLFRGKEGDTNDFYAVIEKKELFGSYLAMLDYELICDEDNALVHAEAVHLYKQLVKSLLALVVTSAEASASLAAYRVDLINKDYAGRVFLCLVKQIAHTRSAHADKHFNEVGARD